MIAINLRNIPIIIQEMRPADLYSDPLFNEKLENNLSLQKFNVPTFVVQPWFFQVTPLEDLYKNSPYFMSIFLMEFLVYGNIDKSHEYISDPNQGLIMYCPNPVYYSKSL